MHLDILLLNRILTISKYSLTSLLRFSTSFSSFSLRLADDDDDDAVPVLDARGVAVNEPPAAFDCSSLNDIFKQKTKKKLNCYMDPYSVSNALL